MRRFSITLLAALAATGTLGGCALVLGDFTLPEGGAGGSGNTTSSSSGSGTSMTGGCGAEETLCGGNCVKTATDPAHCGKCDHACAAAEVCSKGVCAASCDPGLTVCSAGCVDLKNDAQHCGSCKIACDPVMDGVPHCTDAKCTLACNQGFTACNGACAPLDAGACP